MTILLAQQWEKVKEENNVKEGNVLINTGVCSILGGIFLLVSTALQAEHRMSARDLLELDLETLMTIEIGPSADASAMGLTPLLPGDQLADGGRAGFLGKRPGLETPFSVTSYSPDFIRNQQAASVGDVLQYDPGVRVTRGFGNFQQTYMMRGLPLFSDDMTYNGLYGILPRQYLAAELIERAVVVRGASTFLDGAAPGSALGSGLGGGVNVVPKRAHKTDLAAVTLGYQSDGMVTTSADLGRRSADQRWGLRVNSAFREGDAAVDGESQSLRLATAGTDFRGDSTRVSMDLGFQEHHLHGSTPSIEIAPGLSVPAAPDADSAIAQPWTWSKEEDLFATLRAEHDFSSRLTGWVAVGTRHGHEESNVSAFLTVFNDAGDFSANRFDVARKDLVRTGDTGLRLTLDSASIRHELALTASVFDLDTRSAFAIFDSYQNNLYQPRPLEKPSTVSFAGGDLSHPVTTQRLQSTSFAFAHRMYLLDEHLQLLYGLRHQRISDRGFDYDSGDRLSRYDESAPAPVAAALYRLTAAWAMYLRYNEGLEQGDIAPASNANGNLANAGESLQPYRVRSGEAGVKYQAGDLGSELAVFRLRRPVTALNRNNALVEQGAQVHEGVELRGYGDLPGRLRWLGGISLLRTDSDGEDVIGAPRWQGNLNLEWDVPGRRGLTFTGHVTATGSQYADSANLQKVPDWHRLDLGLRQQWPMQDGKILMLRANLFNVSDRDQWVAAGGYPGSGYLIAGEPRRLVLSTQLSF